MHGNNGRTTVVARTCMGLPRRRAEQSALPEIVGQHSREFRQQEQ